MDRSEAPVHHRSDASHAFEVRTMTTTAGAQSPLPAAAAIFCESVQLQSCICVGMGRSVTKALAIARRAVSDGRYSVSYRSRVWGYVIVGAL
ncbi:hypothetical protein ACG7TL_000969 [Trametes sanguinea]